MMHPRSSTHLTPFILRLLFFTYLFSAAPPCPYVAARGSSPPSHPALHLPLSNDKASQDARPYSLLQDQKSEILYNQEINHIQYKRQTSRKPFDQGRLAMGHAMNPKLSSHHINDIFPIDVPSVLESQTGDAVKNSHFDGSQINPNMNQINDANKNGTTNYNFTNQTFTKVGESSSGRVFTKLELTHSEIRKYYITKNVYQLSEPLLQINNILSGYIGENYSLLETKGGTYMKDEKEIRQKRSNNIKMEKATRVKTGDTILNIHGELRDAIGDAGAMPGTVDSASSRVDAFVIRPDSTTPNVQRDPSVEPLKYQAPKYEHNVLVVADSRVRIPCDLSNVTNLHWFKDNEQVLVPAGPTAGEAMWHESWTLVIDHAAPLHAASWRCAGLDAKGIFVSGKPRRLLIYEPVRAVYLAVDWRRLDAGNTWVPVQDKTLLEVQCVAEGGVPAPELTWKLLSVEPTLNHGPYLRIHPTNYSVDGQSSSRVVVLTARELHNAILHCEANQRIPPTLASVKPPTNSSTMSAKIEIHVTYPPSFVISRWPGFGVALVAGGAAALRCDVDANPPAIAYWLRDEAHQSRSPLPLQEEAEVSGSATLRWTALNADNAGWYRCRASWLNSEYSSIGYYLNVLAPEDIPPQPQEDEPTEHQKVEVPVGVNADTYCPNAGVTATAVGTVATKSGWRLQCGVCGRSIQVIWLVKHRVPQIGTMTPDLPRHCWRAELHVTVPDEVWCVAVSGSSGGAAAVFPVRLPSSTAPFHNSVGHSKCYHLVPSIHLVIFFALSSPLFAPLKT